MSNFSSVRVAAEDSMSIDAFGRWRVSQPQTIFDSKQIFDNQPYFWDDQEVSGGSTTSTYSQPYARTQMLVAASTAGNRTRQTFMRFNYQPGKSQMVLMTSRLSSLGAGISSSVGLFDDNDGIFFRVLNGVLYAVIRSSVTGSLVDTPVAQTSFNRDKLNGTGASGVTLDMTKAQIMFVDYEWLGVGRVRVGFVVDGAYIIAHEFNHANSVTGVYMSTPNLPLRYELINDGTGAQTTLDHICASVISEGGIERNGKLLRISTAGSALTTATDNVIYAVIGIRLKSTHLGAVIDIVDAAIQIQTASESGEWTLRFNPAVANTFTYGDVTNSALQRVLGAANNTVTGGNIVAGGFITSDAGANGRGGADKYIENAIRLGSAIDGTPDTLVLCWMPNAATANHEVEGSITIRELS